MDARKLVEADMKHSISQALRSNILLNPRIAGEFYGNKRAITSKYTRFHDEEDYLSNYSKRYEQGEFLAAFKDGAFLQINYEFDIAGKKTSYITKMNLCYLPPVMEDGKIKNEYVRIDYSNSSDNSFFHAFAHVHVGFRNAIRIPIYDVLLFSEFLDLILYFFYPEDFEAFCNRKYQTTNTQDNSGNGRLTENKVLTKELEKFFYWKTA